MDSFLLMMDAGNHLPDHIKPWTYWMQATLFLAPLLFLRQVPARILILTQLLNTLVAFLVFSWEGNQVTKLFGLGHFLWIWPATLLFHDLKNQAKPNLYRTYAAIAVATITISLLFDIRDTAQWVLGERHSILVNSVR